MMRDGGRGSNRPQGAGLGNRNGRLCGEMILFAVGLCSSKSFGMDNVHAMHPSSWSGLIYPNYKQCNAWLHRCVCYPISRLM